MTRSIRDSEEGTMPRAFNITFLYFTFVEWGTFVSADVAEGIKHSPKVEQTDVHNINTFDFYHGTFGNILNSSYSSISIGLCLIGASRQFSFSLGSDLY